MDFSDFDRLPKRTPTLIILDQPTWAGIHDMPTLEQVRRTVSGRLEEIGRSMDDIAMLAGVGRTTIPHMLAGIPVPIADAMRVLDVLGIKPERLPAEYLEA